MAAKATPDDLLDLGFISEMFKPRISSDGEFPAYIQKVLDNNVQAVKDAVGATVYDDAAKLTDIVLIETYLAAAELWDRRRNIVLANRSVGGGDATALLNMTEAVTADDYREKAQAIITRLKGYNDIAVSAETSTHFP